MFLFFRRNKNIPTKNEINKIPLGIREENEREREEYRAWEKKRRKKKIDWDKKKKTKIILIIREKMAHHFYALF